jgi:hypothetical protein
MDRKYSTGHGERWHKTSYVMHTVMGHTCIYIDDISGLTKFSIWLFPLEDEAVWSILTARCLFVWPLFSWSNQH